MLNEEAKRIMRVDRFQSYFSHKLTQSQSDRIYDVIIINTEYGCTKYTAIDVDGNIIDEEID